MTTTNEHTERVELIQAIRNQLGYDFDPSDCFYEQSLLYRAAALLEAQPAEQAKGLDVAKFFLPPALHDGIAENTAGTYRLRVTGLTIRQIKDIFEDKFLGSMMWSNGAAYPTDGVEIQFVKDQPDATPPAQPAREWVGLNFKDWNGTAYTSEFRAGAEWAESKLREKNAGQPAAEPTSGNWIAADDYYRNVRALDVALNGEEGAAQRPRLTDVLSQVQKVCREIGRPILEAVTKHAADDASDNAPWLTEAHILCTDHGIPMGHITERIRALREKLAADDKAGGEPVAWMREGWGPDCGPYVEFYRDDEMGWRDRKEWTPLYTHHQPQAEAVYPDKANNFYLAVCNFLVWIGREGIVHADDPIIDQLSNALHDIDGGVFKDSLKWPQAEVRAPDGYVLVPVEPTDDMLSAVPKPQEDLPAILKKQAS